MKDNAKKAYAIYLEKSKLDESKMNPVQKVETKRAFMAGFGQALLFSRDQVAAQPTEKQSIELFTSALNEVNAFWFAESIGKN